MPNVDLTKLKSGSLVFVFGHSLISKLISDFEKAEENTKNNLPSHVEIYFGSGDNISVSAEANGVCKCLITRYINQPYRFEAYSLKDMTVEQLEQLKAFAYSRVNVVPYNFLGLVGFLFKKWLGISGIKEGWAVFCSQLSADCFSYLGIPITGNPLPSDQQSPADQYKYISKSDLWELDMVYDNLPKK